MNESKHAPNNKDASHHRAANPIGELFSTLKVSDYRVMVHLGCTPQEQEMAQPVSVSVEIKYATPPAGCQSDDLNQATCYAQICESIKQSLTAKGVHFQLIEKMAHVAYHDLKQGPCKNQKLRLEIHKLYPPIDDLKGGSTFILGDF